MVSTLRHSIYWIVSYKIVLWLRRHHQEYFWLKKKTSEGADSLQEYKIHENMDLGIKNTETKNVIENI